MGKPKNHFFRLNYLLKQLISGFWMIVIQILLRVEQWMFAFVLLVEGWQPTLVVGRTITLAEYTQPISTQRFITTLSTLEKIDVKISYNNPVRTMLYLTSNETIVRVRIFGLNGRKVFQQSLNEKPDCWFNWTDINGLCTRNWYKDKRKASQITQTIVFGVVRFYHSRFVDREQWKLRSFLFGKKRCTCFFEKFYFSLCQQILA